MANQLAVGMTGGHLTIREIARSTAEQNIIAFQGNRSVLGISFSPTGLFLAATPSFGYGSVPLEGGAVRIWRADTGERVAMVGAADGNQSFPQVTWSADGARVAAINDGGLL